MAVKTNIQDKNTSSSGSSTTGADELKMALEKELQTAIPLVIDEIQKLHQIPVIRIN